MNDVVRDSIGVNVGNGLRSDDIKSPYFWFPILQEAMCPMIKDGRYMFCYTMYLLPSCLLFILFYPCGPEKSWILSFIERTSVLKGLLISQRGFFNFQTKHFVQTAKLICYPPSVFKDWSKKAKWFKVFIVFFIASERKKTK